MNKYFIPTGDWPLKHEVYKNFMKRAGYTETDYTTADFLLLPGGIDLGLNADRDKVEKAAYEVFTKTERPVVAICRGLQLMLTENGANIIPHIPDESQRILHTTIFSDWRGQSSWHKTVSGLLTNSRHHQGFFNVPNDWEVLDATDDGIIEAVIRGNQFGVQWHPEAPEMENTEAEEWFLMRVKQLL